MLSKEAVEEEQYEDQVSLILNKLLNRQRKSSVHDNPITKADTPVVNIAPNKLKLPNLPLPVFLTKRAIISRSFSSIRNYH